MSEEEYAHNALANAELEIDRLRALVEKAFFEGYVCGYSTGANDAASHEWGCVTGTLRYQREKAQAWEEADARTDMNACAHEWSLGFPVKCRKCGVEQ